jgi:hypothetical protein
MVTLKVAIEASLFIIGKPDIQPFVESLVVTDSLDFETDTRL